MQAEVRNHTVYLSRALTMNTITAESRARFIRLLDKEVGTVDLSAVTESDSACVALLIAALRQKQQQQQSLHCVGMPSGLAQLMALYEVDGWIKP